VIDYGYCQSELCWGNNLIPEADVRRVLQGIKDVGGSRVRMGVQVGTVEDLDRALNLCTEYGIKPLLCLINNPAFGYAASPSAFATMCRTIALRYGPAGTNQVAEYELFNESNLVFNAPNGADPTNFVQYLKAGYTAIKAVHSSSTVIAGGTTPAVESWLTKDPVQWYRGIYAAGGGAYFDAAGFHLYVDGPPSPAHLSWKYMTDLRDLMVANGDTAKKVWVTEVGVGYPFPGVTSVAQARDWLKIMIEGILSYNWMGPPFIYSYRDCTTNTQDANSVFGIVHFDFSPKEPLYSYAKTIAGAAGVDVTPPTAPTGVLISDVAATSVAATWNPSTDDTGVFGYRVYSGGVKIAESATTSVVLSNLLPGSPYTISVTAVDAAGNESTASASASFTTSAPSGLQALFAYEFSGSTVPTVFTQLGLGFSVSSGVALPVASATDGAFYTVAPYNLDQQSVDAFSEISQSGSSTASDRAALAVVGLKPDGSEWVAAGIFGGGSADSCKILTRVGGVVRVRAARNTTPLLAGERLRLTREGNTYTAARISGGVATEWVQWVDVGGVFPAVNRRTGIGWQHLRVGAVNYPAPGITGWRSSDVGPVQTSGGVSDVWTLAVAAEDDWDQLIATGLWQSTV
jgi:hypothetical protein